MSELAAMAEYLQTKITWIGGGEDGPAPPWWRDQTGWGRLAFGLSWSRLMG